MERHAARKRQIAQILTKNGFALVANAAALDPRFERLRGSSGSEESDSATPKINASPEIVRRTIEELGPTAIKLGQALSTRPDLLPQELIDELEKLQSQANPVEWDAVQKAVETELGAAIPEVFRSFEQQPLGTASIGQAHAAELPDGTEVVVKVQRPGIEPIVAADLVILGEVADRLESVWQEARDLHLSEVVAEFADQLRAELDYTTESRNAERIAANLAHRSFIHVPKVWDELSTTRVLTMERLRGLNISDSEALDAAGIDRPQLAVNAATLILDMLLDDGFFHADPHPGNLKVEPDGTIGLLDYGMVGSLTESERDELLSLIVAFVSGSSQDLTTAVLAIAPATGYVDLHSLESDISRLLNRYSDTALGEVSSSEVMNALMQVCRSHHLHPARYISSIARLMTIIEGIGRSLDPAFEVNTVLKGYLLDLAQRRLTPERIARKLTTDAVGTVRALSEFGPRMHRLLTRIDQGGVPLDLDPQRLDPALDRLAKIGDRIIVGIVFAALIGAVGNLGATDSKWLAKLRAPLLAAGTTGLAVCGGYLVKSGQRHED